MNASRSSELRPARRLRRVVAVGVVGILLAGCGGLAGAGPDAPQPAVGGTDTAPSASPSPDPTLTPTVRWEPCGEPFECTTVTVPADHDRPDGASVDLALIRLPAPAAAHRIGSVIVNPGGPGASGADFVRQAGIEVIPAEIRARFDLVGFDPRGVGASRPVTCEGGSGEFLSQDLAPDDPGETAAVLAAAEAYANACAASDGGLLAHLSTRDVARDLDLIRRAVGDAELTYLGYSYGTRIGAAYADLFPDRVRALVLDGAVDPTLDLVGEARARATALEDALVEFLEQCAGDPRCPLDPGRAGLDAFDTLMEDLDAAGLPATRLGAQARLRPGQAHVAVVALLRDRATWPLLEVALAAAWAGDGSYLAAALAPTDGPDGSEVADGMAALMAVNCLDVPAPPPGRLPAAAADLHRRAPRFGQVSLLLHAPCSFWPVSADAPPREVSAAGAPPVVVVGNRGDLITPFAWSERLADQLDRGVLLDRDGDHHTAFGGENVCTDRAVIRYLIDLIPPDPARSCG